MNGERSRRRKIALATKCEYWDDAQEVCFADWNRCACLGKARRELEALRDSRKNQGHP